MQVGQPQDRQWTVDLRVYDTDENGEAVLIGYDRDAAVRAYVEAETIQHREGGTFIVAPLRVKEPAQPGSLQQGEEWVNIGLVFTHKFAPPVRRTGDANGRTHTDLMPPEAVLPEPLQEGDEPATVMPQASDPPQTFAEGMEAAVEEEHTDPRPSDLPEPAPVARRSPAELMPEVG